MVKLVRWDPPAPTQRAEKQKVLETLCVCVGRWGLGVLVELRTIPDEDRKMGGGLVMRPHGSKCDGTAWPPMSRRGTAVLELSEGPGVHTRL